MLTDILKGILSLFIQPLTYLFIFGLFLLGLQRVRRERRSFGLKVYGTFNEVWFAISPSLLMGLLGSIILMGLGISLPIGVIVLLTAAFIITMLTLQFRYLSPLLAVGLTIFIIVFLPPIHTGVHFINNWFTDIYNASLWELGVLLAVGALLEALLLIIWGWRHSSPRLINSKRGKMVGGQEASHMWIVPVLFLIPMGHITGGHWWPLSHGTSFGLGIFPLGIGLQQLITYSLPKKAVQRSGGWVLLTALVITLLVGLSYFHWTKTLVLIAALIGILSRLGLVLFHYFMLDNKPFYYTEVSDGLRVVGIIPGSPAETMDVKIGEVIVNVNGHPVRTERDFYEGLHLNLAYCKIDIMDHDGELRFVKGMTHENDLHQIGFLFIEPSNRVKA